MRTRLNRRRRSCRSGVAPQVLAIVALAFPVAAGVTSTTTSVTSSTTTSTTSTTTTSTSTTSTTSTSTSTTTTTSLQTIANDVTFADPDVFSVKGNWCGSCATGALTLGIPDDLGGIMFSEDGATLYVVGAADTSSSAVYAVGVMRDPQTQVVLDLVGPATKVFDGSVLDAVFPAGLDAGLERGPGGGLFYTYLAKTGETLPRLIAQRPDFVDGTPGPAGAGTEACNPGNMWFPCDVSGLAGFNVDRGVGGLTFNPLRFDDESGFGTMLANDGIGFRFREVLLVPDGFGLFVPVTTRTFVQIQPRTDRGGFGGMQFLPAPAVGGLAYDQGDLMYASYTDGELRIIDIDATENDPPSGLPLRESDGVPTLGTTDPRDVLFASGFGEESSVIPPTSFPGPFGLDIDPLTNDLFVSTFGGVPANIIYRIGGFSSTQFTTTTTLPTTSSTTSTSTSTSSTTSTSSSTSSTTSSTTSTSTTSTTSTTVLGTTTTSTTLGTSTTSTTQPPCSAGECNGDGDLTTADVTCIILRLFDEIPQASSCEDCNDDGLLTTADVTCAILCLFDLCPGV